MSDTVWRDYDRGQGLFLQNFAASVMQDDPILRTGELQGEYLRAMGTLSPERIPGYNAFEDEGVQAFLSSQPTAAHLFARSGSFIESQAIANVAQRRIDREQELEASGAGASRFIAALLAPMNLASAGGGIGTLGAATRLGRAAQATGRAALLGGVSELPFALTQGDLPGSIQGDPLTNIALSAAFGAALGGLAGSFSTRELDRAADRFGAAHDANDGLQTPGVPPRPPAGDWASRPPENMTELGERPMAGGARMLPDDDMPRQQMGQGSEGRIDGDRFEQLAATLRRLVGDEATLRVNDDESGSLGTAFGPIVRLGFNDGADQAEGTLRHEAIHSLRNLGKIAPEEWAVLTRAAEAQGWKDRFNIERRYEGAYMQAPPGRRAEMLVEEAVAEQYRAFVSGAFVPDGPLAVIFQKMREFVERVTNSVRGLGYQSADDVMRAIESGELAPRKAGSKAPMARTGAATAERVLDDTADGPVFRDGDAIRAYDAEAELTMDGRSADAGATPPPYGSDEIMFARPDAPPTQDDLNRILPTGLGIERALGQTWMPYYWLKNTKMAGTVGPALRRLADQIVQTPGLQMAGVRVAGYAQVSDSVEALKKSYGVRYHHAIGAQDAAYYRHMGWDPEAATPFRSRVTEIAQQVGLSKQAGRLNLEEFDQAVGLAIAGDGTTVPQMRNAAGELVDVPEALEAAKVWREFYDRFETEAAEQGILLTAKHKPAAAAAIQAEMDVRSSLIADLEGKLEATTDGPLRKAMEAQMADLQLAQATSGSRMKWLAELTNQAGPYVPHSWREAHVRKNRDELEGILQREWAIQSQSGGATTWAAPQVRASLAVSHILGDGVADTLERLLFAHWKRSRPAEEAARLAGLAAADIRRLEAEMGPGRVRTEIDSALGRRSPDDAPGAGRLAAAVTKAVTLPGMDPARVAMEVTKSLGLPSTNDLSRPWNARQRQIDVPTAAIADFLDLSQRAAGADYSWRMGASIEFARKFGDPQMLNQIDGIKVTAWDEVAAGRATVEDVEKAVQAVKDLRDKVQGNFSIPQDASAYSVRGVRFLTNTAVMAQMGGALFSQVADLGRVVMAHGLRDTLSGAMDALNNRAAWTLAGDEARDAGAALELTNLGRTRELNELRDIGADVTVAEKFAQQGAQMMQFVNLTASWTNMMQRFSGAMHQSAMVRLSQQLVEGRLSEADAVRLRAYGIDPAMAQAVHANWLAAGGDVSGNLHLANTNAWTDIAAQRRFRAALTTAVDISVMKPGAADRPNFMSAPMGQMMFLYKGFAIASTQRMLMAGLQQRDGRVLSGMMASITLAWLVQQATGNELVQGTFVNWDAIHDKNTQRAAAGPFEFGGLATAIDRSGVLGIFGDLNNVMEMATSNAVGMRPLLGITPPTYAKNPTWAQRIGAASGAATAPWLNLMWALTADEAKGDQVSGAVRRLLPFNNLLWTKWAFGALGREAGAAIGDPERGARQ